jgi:hypothetical protein
MSSMDQENNIDITIDIDENNNQQASTTTSSPQHKQLPDDSTTTSSSSNSLSTLEEPVWQTIVCVV